MDLPPLEGGAVAIDKSTGLVAHIEREYESTEEREGGTTILAPGFINAHTHLELYASSPTPILPEESMADWLSQVTAQNKAQTKADRLQNCLKSILELIRTGTTFVNDITSDGASLDALSQIGMRGIVSPEFFYPGHDKDPDLTSVTSRVHELQNRFALHPLLEIGLSPHSPYNVSPSAWAKALKELSPPMIHTHIAETQAEIDWFLNGASSLDEVHLRFLGKTFGPTRTGISPLETMADYLNDRTILAHGTFLSEADWKQIQTSGASLVHCPRSNQWLTGKTLPNLKARLMQGIPIGLGTDSRFSCPDLDMRAEAREARRLHGLSAEETLLLLTRHGAKALHRDHEVGYLAPGMAADMVLWWHPSAGIHDPFEILLDPETQPLMVWINGRIVLERALDTV